MSFAFITRSLRQVLPRREIRERDRRPGAYPVKSKTGDRTRSGRNSIYFDDARSILFLTGVNITYPTTQQFDPGVVAGDLTASIGSVIGNVDPYAVDQFIPSSNQTERVGSFFDCGLFEQDETNVVNSKFMTGAAYAIASDRFKSKISNKTILRAEFPLTKISQMSTGSAIMYFNPTSGCFVTIANEGSYLNNGQSNGAMTFAPLPFTPYGMHYMPLNDYDLGGAFGGGGYGVVPLPAEQSVQRMVTYQGDGSDSAFFSISGYSVGFATASVLNSGHVAKPEQTFTLENKLGHPFLIEKIVVEFPFQAGPGWLNDNFRFHEAFSNDLQYLGDGGGPMITFALMRQDAVDKRNRDIIASGTITTMMDMQTGSYHVISGVYGGGGGYSDAVVTPDGVANLGVVPSVTIAGQFLSSSNNFFTGTVRMTMDPQITSHVLRQKISGSAYFINKLIAGGKDAIGSVFGPISRRSAKYIESGRSVLGNDFALLDPKKLDQKNNPVNVMDAQYENGTQKATAPRIATSKMYVDVKSTTIKSPYLIYPNDKLLLCLSKHRACGDDSILNFAFGGDTSADPNMFAYHDVAIGTGSFKITLYGDLIKEDIEFHDTLNQRLETEELWQDVGEDPVLDQFDVSYRYELSGTYVDRFNVLNVLTPTNIGSRHLTSSMETTSYFSNFAETDSSRVPWSTQQEWSSVRYVDELKKNSRNRMFVSTNEKFWDTRVPHPREAMYKCNPNFRLVSIINGDYTITRIMYTGMSGSSINGVGISDWVMTYPFEPRYSSLTQIYVNTLGSEFFPGASLIDYGQIAIQYGMTGSAVNRLVATESDTSTVSGATFSEFVKFFYGIGDGKSDVDNQHVRFLRSKTTNSGGGVPFLTTGAVLRGWRYGLMSGFPMFSRAMFRRDHYGQPRDLLEQRLDAKFFDEIGLSPDGTQNGTPGVKNGPVRVSFYDSAGNQTDPIKTLSSNISFEATSSMPYTDGQARNRPVYDFGLLNIVNVTI
jgi:hypothetical protein